MKVSLEYESGKYGIGIYKDGILISHVWLDDDADEYKTFDVVIKLIGHIGW